MQSAMTAAEGGDVPKLDAEPHGLQEMHLCAPNPLWEKGAALDILEKM